MVHAEFGVMVPQRSWLGQLFKELVGHDKFPPLQPIEERVQHLQDLATRYDNEDVHSRVFNDRRYQWHYCDPAIILDRRRELYGVVAGTPRAAALVKTGDITGCCQYGCPLSSTAIVGTGLTTGQWSIDFLDVDSHTSVSCPRHSPISEFLTAADGLSLTKSMARALIKTAGRVLFNAIRGGFCQVEDSFSQGVFGVTNFEDPTGQHLAICVNCHSLGVPQLTKTQQLVGLPTPHNSAPTQSVKNACYALCLVHSKSGDQTSTGMIDGAALHILHTSALLRAKLLRRSTMRCEVGQRRV